MSSILHNEGVVIRRRRRRNNEKRRREEEEAALNGESRRRNATQRDAYAEKEWKGREEEKEMDISVMTSRE